MAGTYVLHGAELICAVICADCAHIEKAVIDSMPTSFFKDVPMVVPPPGWARVDGQWICRGCADKVRVTDVRSFVRWG